MIVVGDAFSSRFVGLVSGRASLAVCDPPYGRIVREDWDVADYQRWFETCAACCLPSATICMFGGVGKKGERPFIRWIADFDESEWQIKNWVTWRKKRAYGVSDNYLFTREEMVVLTRGTPTFNVPYLAQERGYEGYNKKYPAKSKFLRRTNVWTDITELFGGKIHPTQKPDALYEVIISTHSAESELVVDLCAGSGVTARVCRKLGRRFFVVEKRKSYLEAAGLLNGWVIR